MALRQIRKDPDELLYKRSREVTVFDERLHQLIDDMIETLRKADGAGLAAVQVGVLKRVAVVDDGNGLIELVNPTIIKEEGTQTDTEGCLSFPGLYGKVTRPKKVRVKAQDRNGNEVIYEGSDLLARAFCHEIEHMDGHVFTEKVSEYIEPQGD